MRAARIGPTVCELEGPMPMEKRSKTEMATSADSWREMGLGGADCSSTSVTRRPPVSMAEMEPLRTRLTMRNPAGVITWPLYRSSQGL